MLELLKKLHEKNGRLPKPDFDRIVATKDAWDKLIELIPAQAEVASGTPTQIPSLLFVGVPVDIESPGMLMIAAVDNARRGESTLMLQIVGDAFEAKVVNAEAVNKLLKPYSFPTEPYLSPHFAQAKFLGESFLPNPTLNWKVLHRG